MDHQGGTGIGAPLPRLEDARFLTGTGRFVDDLRLGGTAHAFVLRSPHGHARIRAIDTAPARAVEGVLAVLTAADVAADRLAPLPCRFFPPLPEGARSYRSAQPALVGDKVRHVGDRIALVVAETLDAARDAAERIVVDYEPLPAAELENALRAGGPRVWDDAPDNLSFELEHGDRAAVERAFASAAHVTRLALHYPRAAASSIEPRAAIAYRDPVDRRLTLVTSTQAPYRIREVVATVLGINEQRLRVIAPDVGGAFGMKGQAYPEEALVAWAASRLGRPVKWTGDRGESLASDTHGRDQIVAAEIALDARGRVLAMRSEVRINLGAYLCYSGGVPPANAGVSYTSAYDVPLIHAVVRAVFTNSCAVGPYRGSGKPEATYVIERLIDKAARELGIDPIEMRRRNLIPASAMPYRTPGGFVYDGGAFERLLERTLDLAEWHGVERRRRISEAAGLRRGIGLAMHCQPAGNQSERMEIRVDPNGTVALHVGTVASGQGHETMFAQMVSEWLGVPLEAVHVFQGDTDKILFGRGTFAQRSMMSGGSALMGAAAEVVRKGRRVAAWMMDVPESEVDFAAGVFRVRGGNMSASFAEVARRSYQGIGLPEEFGVGLDGVGTHSGDLSYPAGCMICEVEVDPATGAIRVDRLAAVDDVGVVVNPLTLEGQLHGSIAQGLGQALVEEVLYDPESGQLLSGSFLDYGMPRADIMPPIRSDLDLVPAKTNPLGVKGGSEAGNVAAPPALINAVIDALAPWNVTDLPLPATPERVWRAMNAARAR